MTELTHEASLKEIVTNQLSDYFAEMKGQKITDLYSIVMEQVEEPLFLATIEHCKYNQSKAAQVLGLSRGTMRVKLRKYFDDRFCGTRDSQ